MSVYSLDVQEIIIGKLAAAVQTCIFFFRDYLAVFSYELNIEVIGRAECNESSHTADDNEVDATVGSSHEYQQ